MVITVNNNVVYTWNLKLAETVSCSVPTKNSNMDMLIKNHKE
jgi:hypothetical protein